MLESNKLFVGGLSHDTDEMALRQYFSKFGRLIDAKVKNQNPFWQFIETTLLKNSKTWKQAISPFYPARKTHESFHCSPEIRGRILKISVQNFRWNVFICINFIKLYYSMLSEEKSFLKIVLLGNDESRDWNF